MATSAVASLDFLLRYPNALLAEPDTPKPCDQLYVPLSYIQYLSALPRETYAGLPGRSPLLRNFAYILEQIDYNSDNPYTGPNGLCVHLWQSHNAETPLPADTQFAPDPIQYAITAAQQLRVEHSDILILTYDPSLIALAALNKIPTVQPGAATYPGRRRITLTPDALDYLVTAGNQPVALAAWQQQIDPSAPLHPNEFIEISNPPPVGNFSPSPETEISASAKDSADGHAEEAPPEPFAAFRRFDAGSGAVIPLKYQTFSYNKCADIHPRSAGQRFLLEALLAPADEIPIVIVQGEFGTGKTFLSIAAGYDGVKTKRYSSIVVCPRDSRLGDDIGALPGDSEDKTRVKALGFTDNLYQVIKIVEQIPVTPKAHSTAKGKMEEFIRDAVEFVPLVEMGGRSLSERFVIYDEVQDMTPTQARALVTRLGDRSKMVIMGDLSQINNPHLSRTNNGLYYLLNRLAGKTPGVAVVNLETDEIVRHPLLREIASCL